MNEQYHSPAQQESLLLHNSSGAIFIHKEIAAGEGYNSMSPKAREVAEEYRQLSDRRSYLREVRYNKNRP